MRVRDGEMSKHLTAGQAWNMIRPGAVIVLTDELQAKGWPKHMTVEAIRERTGAYQPRYWLAGGPCQLVVDHHSIAGVV